MPLVQSDLIRIVYLIRMQHKTGDENSMQNADREPEWKSQIRKYSCEWDSNIWIYFNLLFSEGLDWIQLVQDESSG
jgi:hypothetical protein